MNDRFGERHGKVGIVGTRPSVRDTIACNQRIVFDPDIRPKDFSVVIVDTMNHIQNDSLVLRFFRERIFMHTHPLGCRQLCFHAVVGQHHRAVRTGQNAGQVQNGNITQCFFHGNISFIR